MHTLFHYHCLFHPISMLLHTLNSTLYFVLFRIFNSVTTTVIHCSLPVRRLTYEVFQLVTQRTAWLRTWMGNELLLSTSSSKDHFVSQSSTLQSGTKGEWRVSEWRVKKTTFTRLLLRLFSGLEIITMHRTSYTRSLHQTTVYDILHFVP